MRNFSTLIYLVNGKKSELNETGHEEMESFSEKKFTEKHQPSQRCVDNIMSFARSYEVMESKTTGHVEMILN